MCELGQQRMLQDSTRHRHHACECSYHARGYSIGEGRSTLEAPTLLTQVQATLGALWDAYEDIAVYMEVVKVQTSVEALRGAPAPAACL